MSFEAVFSRSFSPPMTAASDPDAARVAAARGGDRNAFGELVRRHERRVFRLAGRFFRQPAEVEDVAQDTFLTAWSKLATFRGDAPFENWLTRVCLNVCYGRFRRRREEPANDVEPTAPAPDPTRRVEVEQLLAMLPAADRFLLLLLHGEGWTTAEIAERTGWSRANVKVRAHRARQKLRRTLERNLPEGEKP